MIDNEAFEVSKERFVTQITPKRRCFPHVRKQISGICIHHIRTEPVTVETGQSQLENAQHITEKCLHIRITAFFLNHLSCSALSLKPIRGSTFWIFGNRVPSPYTLTRSPTISTSRKPIGSTCSKESSELRKLTVTQHIAQTAGSEQNQACLGPEN